MTTRIAVDAMGGDHAPFEIIAGAVWAAAEYGVALELVGKQDQIEQCLETIQQEGFLSDCGKAGRKRRVRVDVKSLDIKITHASEIIEMGEAPGQAIRKKKNSSIVLTVNSVATGSSDALVAAGSTGAAMASSLFGLGRIPGIDRPAIAVTLPTMKKPIVVIDGGANSNCTPQMLKQFAIMGMTFSEKVLGVEKPRVGVLNIGEEAGKGNELAQATYNLLEEEKEKFTKQLGDVLKHVDAMNEVDTANVEPMAHAIDFVNVMREDEVYYEQTKEELMKNAPDEENGFFRVPKIN